jgi:hypothetical protein
MSVINETTEEQRAETPREAPHTIFTYYNVPGTQFDHHGDRDYTHELHGRSKRGGRFYNVPFGWVRFGLNVRNRYENSEWLLSKDWAIGYYTARWEILKAIIETHDFTADPKVRDSQNRHTYVTPFIEHLMVEQAAPPVQVPWSDFYEFGGYKKYRVALMCKVWPERIEDF